MPQFNQLIIGLTGGIGSGKSAASDFFSKLGIDIVDADIASRIAVEPGSVALSEIANHFGGHLINSDGQLDRSELRNIIFSSDEHRQWLEQLTHPIIRQIIIDQLKQSTSPYTILVSPLLFETDQRELVNRVLVIDASESSQIARATNRDHQTEQQVRAIINSQMEREKRVSLADDIIKNDSSLDELHQNLNKLHRSYLLLAKSHDKK